jgi:hypothetical protein
MGKDPQRNRHWFREGLAAFVLLLTLYKGGPPPSSEAGVEFAYLDPGAGSLLIQVLIAAFAGAAVALKVYWVRIKRFFGLEAAETEEENTERKADSDE